MADLFPHPLVPLSSTAMQITYAPRAWAAERASWRAVTQLNLIRSVNTILDALAAELAAPSSLEADGRSSSEDAASSSPRPSTDVAASIPADRRPAFAKLKLRLAPLRQVEMDLKARLGAGADEVTESSFPHLSSSRSDDGAAAHGDQGVSMMATPFDEAAYQGTTSRRRQAGAGIREIVVRSHKAWKEKERESAWRKFTGARSHGLSEERERERDSATDVLAGCREDMLMLWTDTVVRAVVERRRVMVGLGDSAQ